MQNDNLQILQLDYQNTLDQFKMLAEIRFKLLAFVPTLAGAAIGLLYKTAAPKTTLAVGILGFIVTIGITFYDIRNTQVYDAAFHRAKWLEALLGLPICTQGKTIGGLFQERPGHELKFLGIFKIWHDRGLSLAYGAALGGWTFMIANSSLSLAAKPDYYIAIIIATIVGILCSWQYQRLSGLKKPQPNEDLLQKVSGQITDIDIEKNRVEMTNCYPGCRVKIAEDKREMVAEISDGFAVAVIERSQPHFHLNMQEIYRVLRGTLYVAYGGKGHVLSKGDSITIEPGQIHFARAAGEPVWIEVESTPPWSSDDHFVL
jgi:mannose-6-phosphate isomerase-like protein (cupin superfamily)